VLTNVHHTYIQLDRKVPEKPFQQDGSSLLETDQPFIDWQAEQLGLTIGQVLLDQFPALFSQSIDNEQIEVSKSDMTVVCQGVQIQLDTPIYWL